MDYPELSGTTISERDKAFAVAIERTCKAPLRFTL